MGIAVWLQLKGVGGHAEGVCGIDRHLEKRGGERDAEIRCDVEVAGAVEVAVDESCRACVVGHHPCRETEFAVA